MTVQLNFYLRELAENGEVYSWEYVAALGYLDMRTCIFEDEDFVNPITEEIFRSPVDVPVQMVNGWPVSQRHTYSKTVCELLGVRNAWRTD